VPKKWVTLKVDTNAQSLGTNVKWVDKGLKVHSFQEVPAQNGVIIIGDIIVTLGQVILAGQPDEHAAMKLYQEEIDMVCAAGKTNIRAEIASFRFGEDAPGDSPILSGKELDDLEAELADDDDEVDDEELQQALRLDDDEVKAIKDSWQRDRSSKRWMWFDLIFGGFVVLNAVIIGIQTDDALKEEQDKVIDKTLSNFFEKGFLIAFSTEFVIRLAITRTKAFKDMWMYLDFFLVSIAAADVFSLLQMLNMGNANMFSVVRAFRMVRLVRVIRLVRLLRELWLLVQGMLAALRILMWTIILLVMLLYVYAIMMCETVGIIDNPGAALGMPGAAGDEWVRVRWGSITRSMFTLAQLVTLDGWMAEMRPFWDHSPWVCCLLMLFLVITALGIMNLVVGVMCQTSIAVSREDENTNRKTATINNIRTLMELEPEIARRFGYAAGDVMAFSRRELKAIFEDPSDRHCFTLLQKAQMSLRDITMVLDAMDVHGERVVEIGHLTQALIMLQGDIKDRALDVLLIQLNMKQVYEQVKLLIAAIKDAIVVTFETVDSLTSGVPHLAHYVPPTTPKKGGTDSIPIDALLSVSGATPQPSPRDGKDAKKGGATSGRGTPTDTPRDGPAAITVTVAEDTAAPEEEPCPTPRDGIGDETSAIADFAGKEDGEDYGKDGDKTSGKMAAKKAKDAKNAIAALKDTGKGASETDQSGAEQPDPEPCEDDEESKELEVDLGDQGCTRSTSCQDFTKEMDMFQDHSQAEAIAQGMMRFDAISSAFVLINSLFVGLQTDRVEIPYFNYTIINNAFLVIFIVELVLRVLLYTQLNIEGSAALTCLCCPHFDRPWSRKAHPGRYKNIKVALRKLLRDPFFGFDVLIISIGILDNWVMEALGMRSQMKGIAVLRAARLIRIMRVFRLVRLLKELWLLISSMMFACRTLFWTVCLLCMILYVMGILMSEVVRQSDDFLEMRAEWGSIGLSMWNLLHLITLDDWTTVVRSFSGKSTPIVLALLAFTVVGAMGIMNLTVGIMCETAIGVVEDSQQKQFVYELLNVERGLTVIKRHLNSDKDGMRFISRVDLTNLLSNHDIKNKLITIGGIQEKMCWDIFGKLDFMRVDRIDYELFREACKSCRQPLQNIDMVVCKLMITNLRAECWVMHDLYVRLCAEYNVASDIISSMTEEFADSRTVRQDMSSVDLAQSLIGHAAQTRRRLKRSFMQEHVRASPRDEKGAQAPSSAIATPPDTGRSTFGGTPLDTGRSDGTSSLPLPSRGSRAPLSAEGPGGPHGPPLGLPSVSPRTDMTTPRTDYSGTTTPRTDVAGNSGPTTPRLPKGAVTPKGAQSFI